MRVTEPGQHLTSVAGEHMSSGLGKTSGKQRQQRQRQQQHSAHLLIADQGMFRQ